MERFLDETKSSLHHLDKESKVHIVLGNEACDLDSAVAALVYSFYLYKGNIHPGKVILPVLNVRSNDLRLRTEIVHFFKETNVLLSSLICRDDIDCKALYENGKLSITLVDHNQLSRNDKLYQTSVIEVIDHHQKEVDYDPSRCQVTIDLVGSCCTLIAEILLNKQPELIDQQIALLLYGTILLDTICLSDLAKRATAKDKAIVTELEKILVGCDRRELFQKLYEAKFDISALTMEDLLHRDFKVISNNTMNIAIASLTTSLETVLARPTAESELQKFSSETKSQIVVLLGIQIDMATQETARQLAVYSAVQGYREQLMDVLEGVSLYGPKLQLQSVQPPFPSVTLYHQGNATASRKVILPLLKTFLLGDKSPSLSNGSGSSCSGLSMTTTSEVKLCNKRTVAENRSEDDDFSNFDPLTSESEDVFDSLANSATHLHVLGMGDPISHAGSSQSSSNQNSCPYTPQNSCTDGGLELDPYARQILPSFNSREMMEKIERKRGKLRGYVGEGDIETVSYPFTPKNSFVDNNMDSYAKSVPAFDSGDFLFKVNEKVSTMTASVGDEGNGNITVEVPVIDHPADIKTLKNGHLDISAVKEKYKQMEIENGSQERQISVNSTVIESEHESQPQDGNDKGQEIVQCCPEAISLSEKLDKSDEKMDTSETSGSSEKTLPLDDLEVSTSTQLNCLTTDTITHTSVNASATIPTNSTTVSTNANLLFQKPTEIHSETVTSNVRTESTASTASLQEDTDLELPSNYQAETVDFPDSPRQMKLMNQSSHIVQGASIDESLQEEEEETEQPDDEVFRAVLSPSSEGVKLKKAKKRIHVTPEIERGCTPPKDYSVEYRLSFESDMELEEDDDYYEENVSADTSDNYSQDGLNDVWGLQKPVTECTQRNFVTPEQKRLSHQTSSQSNQVAANTKSQNRLFYDSELTTDINIDIPEKKQSFCSEDGLNDAWTLQKPLKASTPMNFVTPESGLGYRSSLQNKQLPINSKNQIKLFDDSELTTSRNIDILRKVQICCNEGKIKDISVLAANLKDRLRPEELREILENSEIYASCLEDDKLEVLQHLKMMYSKEDKCKSEAKTKTKIAVIKEDLDESIADHFESELYISAIFECTKSLKRQKKSTMPNHPSNTIVDNLVLKEVPCGATQAYFEESVYNSPTVSAKKKITAPIILNSFDMSTSPEMDCTDSSESKLNERFCSVKGNISATEAPLDVEILENPHCDRCSYDPMTHSPRRIQQDEWQEDLVQERPNTLNASGKKKRKIKVNPDILNSTDEMDDNKSLSSLSNKSDGDILSPIDDMATPDDIDTPEELEDSTCSPSEPIPEVSAAEERDEERRWRTCVIGGVQRKIDMKVIEPYKKVLSHGGYYGPKRSAIIVFCACYLPDHSRKDYDYVMDNLFLYVLTTLDQLVAEDYILIYLHGAMERNNMPTFGWLKRCYQMIDRRLRKNLKGLYLVHPTFWLKTIVLMTKPFISSKFSRKLQFVNTLQELTDLVPIDPMSIPDRVKQLEFKLMIKEKKRHLKLQKHITPQPQKQNDKVSNCDDDEEAYRQSQGGYITLTGGWV